MSQLIQEQDPTKYFRFHQVGPSYMLIFQETAITNTKYPTTMQDAVISTQAKPKSWIGEKNLFFW